MLRIISKRLFNTNSTVISVSQLNKELDDVRNKISSEAQKVGADLVLPSDVNSKVCRSGVIFNTFHDFPKTTGGWYLNYLKNMGLIRDYESVFRDFLQSIARKDDNYLDLVSESRLADHIIEQLNHIRKAGYIIDLENLKIKQEYEVADWSVYKNLRIRREENPSNFRFEKYGKLSIARVDGEDKSIYDNIRPFILSSLMKVKTPMKLSIFNQNFSAKLYGKGINESLEYLVKFETELNYSDFLWILPTVNKPSRARRTRITDINNVLEGNDFLRKI